MADQSDVEIELAALITEIIYPAGPGAGPIGALGSILVDIRRGWPIPSMLDAALASGSDVLVRIYPEPGMTRNTSRFVPQWRDMDHTDPTLTAAVSGSAVTFAGIGDPAQVAGIRTGRASGSTYAYRLLAGDGPTQVALAFQAMIGGSTAVSGGVVTLVTDQPILARVVNDQQQFLETRRQDQGFRISIWSANAVARDAVASAIDNALAYLTDDDGNPTMTIPLPDNSVGWLRYRSTYNLDGAEKAGLYRRDLCYLVEYPTSITRTYETVLFGLDTLTIDLSTPNTTPQVLRVPVINLSA